MSATDASLVVTLGVSSALVAVVLYVWTALALGAVFRKSGEQSWKAWVPILNIAVLLQLGGFSGWLVLLLLLPVLGSLLVWVAMIVACHRIGREFGYGAGMTVLAALLLPVWASVLGFGSARWVGTDDAGPRRSVNPDLGGSVSEVGGSNDDEFDDRVYGVPTARGAVYTPLLPAPDYAGSRETTRSEASWEDTVRGTGVGEPADADLGDPELDEDSSTDEARRSSPSATTPAVEPSDTAPIARASAEGRRDADDDDVLSGLFAAPEPPRFTPPDAEDVPAAEPAAEPEPVAEAAPAASDPFSIPSWPSAPAASRPDTPVRSGPVWPSVEPFRPVRSWDPDPAEQPAASGDVDDAPAPAAPRVEGASGAEAVAAEVSGASADEREPDAGSEPGGAAASRAEIRRSASVWNGFVLDQDVTGEVTGAVTGAPAPIAAVPGAVVAPSDRATPSDASEDVPGIRRRSTADGAAAGEDADPASSAPLFQAPLARVPSADPAPETAPAASVRDDDEPWRPAHSPMPESEPFPETSGPVSAIAGAPVAGTPRAAGGAVSAQYARPGVPDLDDGLDQTIVARRRRTNWAVVTPAGESIAITSDIAILGRKPLPDPDHPRAQLIRIDDSTVSSTHARLELRKDTWYILDLGSTNGVVFATLMGTEVEAPSGVEVEAGDRFFLGDAEIRLVRSNS
ncbi:pSer/pThr/pTyr-binding forkhead associated (FHA) protein [Microbacterium sp. SLBN-154]|uniref:DUF5684 domain-containing protein n=1 Tax=Microbacterium sp. SLBN-154 TaxID=2768458 RepID=UPI001150966E|nr:DUF5684 domain-containing protein [Microbacterium sp. SLBN-154]TQK18452.1 pSer/pThr/pTyr-binding forkhead associated (FHA) protein [Microbacterium sp. SLBN-154]